MKTTKLKTVVYKRPGERAVVVQLKNIDLDYLQAAVRGDVQAIPFEMGQSVLWCNEDGALSHLAPNVVTGLGLVRGTIVVTGKETPAGNTRGLTFKQAYAAARLLSHLAFEAR